MDSAERETFDAFVVARGPALVRFAHALSGDHHLAEDLVQDVLVKVHRRWDRIAGSPESYVRSALVHELVSWRRRRSHHEQPASWLPEAGAAGPESAVAEHDAVWRLLGTLPPRQRAVLVLRYWEALPDAEIARLLGLSQGSVRSLASRAFGDLRRHPELAYLSVPAENGAGR